VIALTFDDEDRCDLLRAGRRMYAAAVAAIVFGLGSLDPSWPDVITMLGWLAIAISLLFAAHRVRRIVRVPVEGELRRALWHLRNALAIKGIGFAIVLVFYALIALVPMAMAFSDAL
jgi:hypothetical protein